MATNKEDKEMSEVKKIVLDYLAYVLHTAKIAPSSNVSEIVRELKKKGYIDESDLKKAASMDIVLLLPIAFIVKCFCG
ncbi:hypothetical protein ACFO25_10080 [Paenactinomyces guangxiensis]|uniref:Uncharacterized protein n=1 Tax=Paenactinomyces guangxiensis TaxID=1490290 RepID=A0A7W1WSF2_9BACL|nr:hypothetical protein [Paenactinomyces guangxiensis]MBA4495133.1 hypothetical protein [Paenactinomyces guangxiensis]MBH8592183.1 hypothetical protein [Paenactinomyces guangxiensis]